TLVIPSGRRHARSYGDWSSDVCSADLGGRRAARRPPPPRERADARPLILDPAPLRRRNDREFQAHLQLLPQRQQLLTDVAQSAVRVPNVHRHFFYDPPRRGVSPSLEAVNETVAVERPRADCGQAAVLTQQ